VEQLKDISDQLDLLCDTESLPAEFFSTDDVKGKAFEAPAAVLGFVLL
jgi:hypothetical protein